MNAKMPELKRCFEEAGFTDVKTVLSSGNVVFTSGVSSESKLEQMAEAAMRAGLGRAFMTIVRSVEALQSMIAADPYKGFRLESGAKRVVTFLRASADQKLSLPIEFEQARILRVDGREVFTTYVPGPRAAAFMNLIEKTFGKDVTTRTMETVQRVSRA